MSSAITEQDLFRPARSRTETKADTTDRAARAIIGTEAKQREVKTARLRQARLEMEATQPAPKAPAKPRRSRSST